MTTGVNLLRDGGPTVRSTPKPPDIEWTWTKDGRLTIEWEDEDEDYRALASDVWSREEEA